MATNKDVKPQTPHNGEWSGNMSDEWQEFCRSVTAYCKQYDFKCVVQTHPDGTGEGLTVYMASASGDVNWCMWTATAWSDFVDQVLAKVGHDFPDGDFVMNLNQAGPGEVLLHFWHD